MRNKFSEHIIWIILLASLSLLLASCGNENKSQSLSSESTFLQTSSTNSASDENYNSSAYQNTNPPITADKDQTLSNDAYENSNLPDFTSHSVSDENPDLPEKPFDSESDENSSSFEVLDTNQNTSADCSDPTLDNSTSTSDDYKEYGFVLLTDVIPDVVLEIRYYSTFNFVGERIDYYNAPVAYLTAQAAQALKKANDDLMSKGYRIKIYDAYRPKTAVEHFKRWASDLEDEKMKAYFYPEVDKSKLFEQGYISSKSSHSRGSTVDLTIIDMKTGREVDMGSGFDYFGEISHPGYTKLTDEQKNNRNILREAMINAGFRPVSTEWWHFTLKNEPYKNTYFDFPIT